MTFPEKPERLARRTVYAHDWLSLHVDRVRFPGGRVVEEFHVLDPARNCAAALVENDRGEILLVQSYRYVTDSIGWEIPAGLIDHGETPIAAACREALEESGYEATDPTLVYAFHRDNGISPILAHVVRCRVARDTGRFDVNESRARRWASRAEIRGMIGRGEILDGFSLAALLLWLQGLDGRA